MQSGVVKDNRKLSEQSPNQVSGHPPACRSGGTHVSARLAIIEPVSHSIGIQ
ncbi:hypothetical protein [Gimesia sp.]|uniref:hypothetical protein n=1 Tax=Gimesia sp. TaxID=2024833 RepID=UPI003A92BF6B